MHDQPFLRNLKFESFHSRCNGIYLIIYGSLNANINLAIDDFHVVWYNKFNKKREHLWIHDFNLRRRKYDGQTVTAGGGVRPLTTILI